MYCQGFALWLRLCFISNIKNLPLIQKRFTCARVRKYASGNIFKIGNKKLLKVDKVKFLSVIIDDKLNWKPHVGIRTYL